MERVICEQEPPRPSTALGRSGSRPAPDKLRRQLSGDLDNIVMRALRKESSRRYSSVEQFADDIRRYLDGRPVIARPDTWRYRTAKFARRNALLSAAALAFVVLLAAFGVTMSLQAARMAAERDAAANERTRAQQVVSFLVELFELSDPGESRGNRVTAREILDIGAARISRELEGQQEIQATLMNTMGDVYRNLGLYDEAKPLIERSLEPRREVHGPRHLAVAEGMSNLGNLQYERGDYESAEALVREASSIRQELLGENNAEVALSLNDLGWLAFESGRYEQGGAQLVVLTLSWKRE